MDPNITTLLQQINNTVIDLQTQIAAMTMDIQKNTSDQVEAGMQRQDETRQIQVSLDQKMAMLQNETE